MLDAEVIRLLIKEKFSLDFTVEEVQSEIDKHNRQSLEIEETKRYKIELWDRVKSINGVSADKIIANRNDIPEVGDVYLIYIDNKLVYFQPHSPTDSGYAPIEEGQGIAIAEQHVMNLVDSSVDDKIAELVINSLVNQ